MIILFLLLALTYKRSFKAGIWMYGPELGTIGIITAVVQITVTRYLQVIAEGWYHYACWYYLQCSDTIMHLRVLKQYLKCLPIPLSDQTSWHQQVN